ncbi:recombining binding protein suppressor of hairless-like protein isoform X1 [Syngnathus typhle]|uniref:recombining binding protein suppressor of hairless-like protein isoform X1 n=1 Tax=Syngnathus typhle TaxID=161592 RepID=UPI002A6A3336|nr:recombining binding protein suppressor of hairless-like protein isoform X1 [Syngnathus typhle]
MNVAAMLEQLAAAIDDGCQVSPCVQASTHQVSPHRSAHVQAEEVTHLLDDHVSWDRRMASACRARETLRAHSVVILHAKVAQKSYGNEKRFFCPPPCVYANMPRPTRDLLKAEGLALNEGMDSVHGYMCVDSATLTRSDTHKLNFETLPNKTEMLACAKSLFISDQDKRKHFRLKLGLFLEVDSVRQEVGSFHSRPIKVISKPSQKRQSMKNADLCISAGSRVALFNRLRSQTVSTRYLNVEGGSFVASTRQWTAFIITLVEEQHAEHQGDFVLSEGFVCYGSVVQLVCTESGLTLPPMVIRKVNKQHAVLSVDEPVSQLHKCALEMRHVPPAYLAVADDTVVLHQAMPEATQPGRVSLNDGSCWTIIGVEVEEFAFCQADGACIRMPITPFPDVSGLELSGGGYAATLELRGENLGPHLKVCFGCCKAETVFKSTKCLVCTVPDVCALQCGCYGDDSRHEGGGTVTVPISLRRPCDGLDYRTTFSFTYTPEQPCPLTPPAAGALRTAAAVHRDDAMLDSIHHEFARTNFQLFT